MDSTQSRMVADALKTAALARGFSLAGIAAPGPSTGGDAYRRWIERGMHGEMSYMARPDAIERRLDPTATMASVRSVLVVAHEYGQEEAPGLADDPSRGVIARYARGRDYHRVVKARLVALMDWLRERVGSEVEGRAYVDTGPILERDLARRAGLGWFGRNTMLIHPRHGSYFFLGILLLDLDLPPDEPFVSDHCGSCRACLDACPTGALLGRDEHGAPVLDARLCISYLTIELRSPIPGELRPAIGNRIFGCDICQEICPFTRRFSRPSAERAYAARGPGEAPAGVEPPGGSSQSHPGTDGPPLVELMRMDEPAWEAFSRGSAIRRAGYAGFRRNVAVALGNWLEASVTPQPEAIAVLIAALSDPEPLVRGHAAWALGRAGSTAATAALRGRVRLERDPFVLAELAGGRAR